MWTIISQMLGIGLPAIIDKIVEAKKQHVDAKTEAERIASEERIKTLETKRDIILRGQENRLEVIVRVLWALPFIAYVWKLLIWDKLLGWGATDPLSPTLEYILWTVLGGSFILGVKGVKK